MIDTLAARRAVLWTLIAAKIVAAWGLTWDIQWHMTIGRDSFWIPPHVMVYASVAVMFVLTFAVVPGRSPSRGFRLAAWAIALVVLAAPIDDLWHRLFGLDATLWSPPHLLGLGGSSLHTLACVVIARELYPMQSRAGLAATLLAAGLFYGSVRVMLDPTYLYAFTYGGVLFHAFAMLAALTLPLPLIVSARFVAPRWAPVAAVVIAIALGLSSDAVARLGFAIVQPESVIREEIQKDPASPIAIGNAIADKNGRKPPPWPARLTVVYAAAAMAIVDPRRRPIVASVVFGVTLFACSGFLLSLRPAFAPMTPGAVETAIALAVTLVAAMAGGLVARYALAQLSPNPEDRPMRVDRYIAATLTIIAIALVAIAVNPWLSSLAPRSAEAQGAQYEHTLSKSWGKLVGFSNGNLLLQAEDGTLREIDVREKTAKVKVQVRWN